MDAMCIDCGCSIVGEHRSVRCRSCAARARWAAVYPPRFCKVCKQEITTRSKARAIYCSIPCKYADPAVMAKIIRRNSVTKVCPQCSVSFSVPVSNAVRYNYCSRACSMDARGRDAVCKRCGAAFRHGQKATRNYCSEVCRRPASLLDCAHCGAQFRVVPSSVSTRRFCSVHCYVASDVETGIERTVRLVLESLRLDVRPQARAGRWTVDFMVGSLVIEADGSYWHSLRPHVDARKTSDLISRGYAVWRLTEEEIRRDDFSAALKRRLADHEIANGELPRLPPFVVREQNRVISGQLQA